MKRIVTDYELLTIIAEYHSEHGYMPSMRELLELTGYSNTSSIHYALHHLFEKGYIESDIDFSGSSRAFRLSKRGREFIGQDT